MKRKSSNHAAFTDFSSSNRPQIPRSNWFSSSFFQAFSLSFVSALILAAAAPPVWGQAKQDVVLPAQLSEDQVLDGWLALFDGSTLFGWKPATQANWKASDGTIRVDGGKRGLLRTTSQFDDFEMTLEYKADANTNSGVFIRTSPTPMNVLKDCYEINIVHPSSHEYSTGAIVGRAKTEMALIPDKQWHHMRVLADGPKIKVWIDSEKTVEYFDDDPIGRGYIGLQYNAGLVQFRNIAIKPLNQASLFNGNNLDAWKMDQVLKSRFDITEKRELRVLGGAGTLESKGVFGDCIISLLCKTNASKLNSGLFFRCIPGELMNGYESQIQNGFKENDRAVPDDCGTGGIFRRVNARRVNANDNAWFAKTVIAEGPHMSVWVNGYQVTDWTDQRKPDKNPRKGFRAEAGTLMLQGHDPTTDILFRNIQAKELSPRRK